MRGSTDAGFNLTLSPRATDDRRDNKRGRFRRAASLSRLVRSRYVTVTVLEVQTGFAPECFVIFHG